MKQKEWLTQRLYEKGLISETQFISVKAYRSLGIFSLRNELLFLMYLSVLFFSAGIGIVVYQNIDSLGHMVILSVILILALACFRFSFRRSAGYSPGKVEFENPVFDYLVLCGTALAVVFFGYLQTQYETLGSGYSLAALASALIALTAAYYFDNRAALSIGITSLAAFVGITATPEAVVRNEMYVHPAQTYFGLMLGMSLIAWYEYSKKHRIKQHFSLVIATFALHLVGISCIKGLFEEYWPVFVALTAASCFYFYKMCYELSATSLFVFTMLYAYMALNVVVGKFLSFLESMVLIQLITFVSPAYLIASIFLFIRLTKRFNQSVNDGEE